MRPAPPGVNGVRSLVDRPDVTPEHATSLYHARRRVGERDDALDPLPPEVPETPGERPRLGVGADVVEEDEPAEFDVGERVAVEPRRRDLGPRRDREDRDADERALRHGRPLSRRLRSAAALVEPEAEPGGGVRPAVVVGPDERGGRRVVRDRGDLVGPRVGRLPGRTPPRLGPTASAGRGRSARVSTARRRGGWWNLTWAEAHPSASGSRAAGRRASPERALTGRPVPPLHHAPCCGKRSPVTAWATGLRISGLGATRPSRPPYGVGAVQEAPVVRTRGHRVPVARPVGVRLSSATAWASAQAFRSSAQSSQAAAASCARLIATWTSSVLPPVTWYRRTGPVP